MKELRDLKDLTIHHVQPRCDEFSALVQFIWDLINLHPIIEYLHGLNPQTLNYRSTSLIRNNAPLGPYSRTMPLALWLS
jgi:hypothetical protein